MIIELLRGATLAVALLGTTSVAARNSVPMDSTALLIKPLTLTKLSDLDFGTIIPSGTVDEFVTINAMTGTRTSPTANLVSTNQGNRARFCELGCQKYRYIPGIVASPLRSPYQCGGGQAKAGISVTRRFGRAHAHAGQPIILCRYRRRDSRSV